MANRRPVRLARWSPSLSPPSLALHCRRAASPPPRLATPRQASPRLATPRLATPRRATPRHAAPYSRRTLAVPSPYSRRTLAVTPRRTLAVPLPYSRRTLTPYPWRTLGVPSPPRRHTAAQASRCRRTPLERSHAARSPRRHAATPPRCRLGLALPLHAAWGGQSKQDSGLRVAPPATIKPHVRSPG